MARTREEKRTCPQHWTTVTTALCCINSQTDSCLLQTFNLPLSKTPLTLTLTPAACLHMMDVLCYIFGTEYLHLSTYMMVSTYSIMSYILLFTFYSGFTIRNVDVKLWSSTRYNIWTHVPVLNIFKLDHLYAKKIGTHFTQKSSSINQRRLQEHASEVCIWETFCSNMARIICSCWRVKHINVRNKQMSLFEGVRHMMEEWRG